MSAPAQVVQLTCPNCGSPLRAQIVTFLDVGQQPQLKNYLLSGQMNMAVCQACGNAAAIAAPLIYHDPAKQLFLSYFPQQLNAKPEEQERFVGEATALLMRTLPPEQPKGYILAPKRFLTLNTLIETVLEADGVTKEMIESQRRQLDLISTLAEAYEQNPEQLPALVAEHRAVIDAAFFTMLDAFVAQASQSTQDGSAEMLRGLRDQVAGLTGYEGEALDDAGEPELELIEALDRLSDAGDDELELLVAELRPLIDYSFFKALTERIETAVEAEATRLTSRRSQILEIAERQDREAQEMFDAGALLLEQALQAEDPAAVLREQRGAINEAFLLVLEANRGAAERAGQQPIAERLAEIQRLAVQVVEESLSPEERFINQLLSFETPQEATALLRRSATQITVPLVKRLNELADEMLNSGRAPVGERLRQLAREAGAMLF
ncbi:MAG: CpXC domain-containing protein [Roseiflexaceae bacterium]|nr:CpXC domain-containing protein [Roseiflexaceae bacterium]